ncbi:MAG TPA: general stress protein [Chloroflexia bacterium]|nr:general stress protein [Chloroflexia bacterium]
MSTANDSTNDNTGNASQGYTLVGVFDDSRQAENAINTLRQAGFGPNEISVVTRELADQRQLDTAAGNQAPEGALAGSLGGGTLGAVLGWLLAGGTALIPGIGPVAAAGIFAATVGGALIGGTVGGVSGALIGQGVPESEAEDYEAHVKAGRTLVAVNVADTTRLNAAKAIFENAHAYGTRFYDQRHPGHTHTFTGPHSTTPDEKEYASAVGTVPVTERDFNNPGMQPEPRRSIPDTNMPANPAQLGDQSTTAQGNLTGEREPNL